MPTMPTVNKNEVQRVGVGLELEFDPEVLLPPPTTRSNLRLQAGTLAGSHGENLLPIKAVFRVAVR